MEWMILPLKRYAEFSGRSCRKEFWMFTLLNIIIVLPVAMGVSASKADPTSSLAFVFRGLIVLWVIGTFVPGLAVQVRRFHDQDKSGLFVLLGFIPYIGGLILLAFMLLEGTPGLNQYGPDPVEDETLSITTS